MSNNWRVSAIEYPSLIRENTVVNDNFDMYIPFPILYIDIVDFLTSRKWLIILTHLWEKTNFKSNFELSWNNSILDYSINFELKERYHCYRKGALCTIILLRAIYCEMFDFLANDVLLHWFLYCDVKYFFWFSNYNIW